jgi:hypothetical protein
MAVSKREKGMKTSKGVIKLGFSQALWKTIMDVKKTDIILKFSQGSI